MSEPRDPIGQLRELSNVVQGLLDLARQLNARLSWYETRVPMIRDEYAAFTAEQISTGTPSPKVPPIDDE